MKKLSEMEWGQALIGHHFREKPGFFSEFLYRVGYKILPPHTTENDVLGYISKLPKDTFADVLAAAYTDEPELVKTISNAATDAYNQLATIVNGAVLNDPVYGRLKQLNVTPPMLDRLGPDDVDSAIVLSQLEDLFNVTAQIRKSFGDWGTSINLSYRNEKLVSDARLLEHLFLLRTSKDAELQHQRAEDLIATLRRENSLSDYVDRKLDLVIEQIVQQNADTGEQYIATSKEEYGPYFKSALLGGVLVAVFAIAKVWLDGLDVPPLTLGLLFGINYAACFSLCALLGGTIATKQPSMTATAFSRNLKNKGSSKELFKRLLASQTVTLFGNVLAAIAVTAAFGALAPYETEVQVSLFEKNRLNVSLIWYAAIAGVFLSVAGLLSGYISNLLEYRQIGPRIHHRFGWKPSKQAGKLTPKIVGSIALGMFLGFSGPLGKLTGLPLDIRHIAFSSAHASIGWTVENLPWLLAGLAAIGTTNLLVSFGITFWVSRSYRSHRAVRSDVKT